MNLAEQLTRPEPESETKPERSQALETSLVPETCTFPQVTASGSVETDISTDQELELTLDMELDESSDKPTAPEIVTIIASNEVENKQQEQKDFQQEGKEKLLEQEVQEGKEDHNSETAIENTKNDKPVGVKVPIEKIMIAMTEADI